MRSQLRNRVRALANDLLRRHGLHTIPVDPEKVAQLEGIRIERADLGPDVAGLLTWTRAGAPVVAINSREDHAPLRQRFTVAHELGHYFLGHRGPVVYDHKTSVLFRREGVTNSHEASANAFAAELLMPEPLLRPLAERMLDQHGWLDDDAVATLAHDFDVSAQAMTIRLSRLGYISEF